VLLPGICSTFFTLRTGAPCKWAVMYLACWVMRGCGDAVSHCSAWVGGSREGCSGGAPRSGVACACSQAAGLPPPCRPDRYCPTFGRNQYRLEQHDYAPVPFEEQVAAVGQLIKEGKVRHLCCHPRQHSRGSSQVFLLVFAQAGGLARLLV
jgi:hypothetical protein